MTWYKDAVIYEAHVRAFADSNGDGIGDLPGLISKLDYLQDLGITALWLLPFMPSPLRDDGYDIADYLTVNPMYGELADVRRLVKEAHRRGIRVIGELVANHTSDQHPWFQRARHARPGSRARNWYVWSPTADRYKDARIIFKDFETSNWAYDPVAKQYYWHRFYSHQPDLNFDEPEVRAAIERVLDHWFDLGFDGLRLDAIPYLYEREGTSCENLPETHAYLKQLRAHLDAKYGDRMLLAEANQWPEDAAAYFGDGDECHMAYHFPVMPRLYMAIRMEDRFPIVDILAQTPPIAENAQWALFLRNHDELTLEMVTDEERDHMYRTYAQDPVARINLGIRRRLAPLLGNDRRRIELMNSLLFSLPGTPIIYYGDEIGMGDNIYLGDRNGVRTPMQWSADRNAGFSRADGQRLYLPPISDGEYQYGTVNVEVQQRNPHSLLSWMKRLIALRKRYTAFGRGEFRLLHPENRKVLAYLRCGEGQTILCVANLSRFAQPCELDLRDLAGRVPVELFGRTEFPPIGELPYFVTLGPHAFQWFLLEERREPVAVVPERDIPALEASGWGDLLRDRGSRAALEAVLPQYIAGRRWSFGKARKVIACRIAEATPLREADAAVLLVELSYSEGEPETYVLPLSIAPDASADETVARLRSGVLVDALGQRALAGALVRTIAKRRRWKGERGELVGVPAPALGRIAPELDDLPDVALSRAEQSNTSLVFGERFIVKLYRRAEEGPHPDVEIGRFLTERAGFAHTPAVGGSLEAEGAGGARITLAMLQGYVPNQGDAWERTLRDVAGALDHAAGQPAPEIPAATPLALADIAVPREAATAFEPSLALAGRLGTRVAELHRALASEQQDPAFAPEAFTPQYQRSLYQSVRNGVSRSLRRLRGALPGLGAGRADAELLLSREAEAHERIRELLERPLTLWRTRIHGDLHLGQVLLAADEPVIIDFEGEPAVPLSERRAKRSPLRDVAGMLRSFDYAAHVALSAREARDGDRAWAKAWTALVSARFLRDYRDAMVGTGLWPARPADAALLLETLLLEKASRELEYEIAARPDWLEVPVRGMLGILDAPRRGP
ncbi:MAG TPA: maltose alpha-D-glucosyltransferase [Candidatus Limnocylindria bacterium]|nr:maltose alpha-D-glucosyltransferase [Candidatus Limnocylindria bacterium]